MSDPSHALMRLHRPKLLIQAARAAIGLAPGDTVVRRAFRGVVPRHPSQAFRLMLDIELELNTQRKTGQSGYALARHIDVVAALLTLARRQVAIK
ncbi:MAG: DUF6477 family protein [Pseudomonadota bacterium]